MSVLPVAEPVRERARFAERLVDQHEPVVERGILQNGRTAARGSLQLSETQPGFVFTFAIRHMAGTTTRSTGREVQVVSTGTTRY